jgi:hypothetical protein
MPFHLGERSGRLGSKPQYGTGCRQFGLRPGVLGVYLVAAIGA